MGSNKSGKQPSFQKKLWQAHTSASAANIKKITTDPTPNKGDLSSLTIVAHDTDPLVSVSRQTVHVCRRRRQSPRSPSPLSPRRSPALLQPHRSPRDDGDEDAVTSVRTYIQPT
jgi:hypothetical protein